PADHGLLRQGRRLRPPGAGRADGLHDACGGREGDQAVLEGSHAAAQGDRPRHRGMSDHSPGTDAALVVAGTNGVRRGSRPGVGAGWSAWSPRSARKHSHVSSAAWAARNLPLGPASWTPLSFRTAATVGAVLSGL